jgi:hypothetical protein
MAGRSRAGTGRSAHRDPSGTRRDCGSGARYSYSPAFSRLSPPVFPSLVMVTGGVIFGSANTKVGAGQRSRSFGGSPSVSVHPPGAEPRLESCCNHWLNIPGSGHAPWPNR